MSQVLPQPKPSYKSVVNAVLKQTIPLPLLQSHGATTASTVLSAWSVVLSKLSGKSDAVFGSVTAGRHSVMPGLQEVVGPCMNIVPVRTQMDQCKTILDLLQQVQSRQLASWDHENVGFRHIIEKCTDWPSWTRFSSIVNHVHIDASIESLFTITDDLKFDFSVHEPMHDKSDLWLQTKPIGNEMEVELRFGEGVIPKVLAEEALQLFCDVVKRASSSVDTPVSSLQNNTIPLSSATSSVEKLQPVVKAAWTQVLFADEEDFDNANSR